MTMLRARLLPGLALILVLVPLAGALLAAAEPATVAQRAAAPRGIYCSCPPTNGVSNSVMPEIAQKAFVEGILVRVAWKDIEPSRGVYDFSLIDGQLALAQQAGKHVALAVVQGPGTPGWLGAQGVQTMTYTSPFGTQTIAAAWDLTYQTIWAETIAALGAAFQNDARISLVHVVNATHNGFEMQLPLDEQALFVAAGYSASAYADSWKRSIDAYAVAFPLHPLDVDVHPVFGDTQVASEVLRHGIRSVGDGFGAFGAWWSVDNAEITYTEMHDLLKRTANSSFANVQVVGSWITTPERFDNDLAEYLETYSLALDSGVRYAEIWNADLLDPGLESQLRRVNRALKRTP